MNRPEYQSVGKSVRKKDSLQLLLGKPVYTDDIAPDALVVKLLRSPHANAIVETIDVSKAKKLPGVVDVYTWEDVPNERFSNAGQTYPETSPYDRLIIDRHVRFVGDVVAIVAAETEEAAEKALGRIKVTYNVLEPVLDFRAAKDNPVLVHPEDNWHMLCDLGGDNTRNLVGGTADGDGDVEAVLADCDIVLERTYHTKAYNQAMMETFRTFTQLDRYGRLHVISSTQIVFHVRRILSNALGIPKSRIRVEKPRIGGGFGAKQTAVCEVYPAFVTMKTGRPAMCIFSRKEAQTCGSPRHEMEISVRLGANNGGRIRALAVNTLSNSGAYGEHGWATVGLTGHKSIPLYTGSLEAFKFTADVVYTNMQPSGAYRGFGATQGQFAVETTVNELADKLGIDPIAIREQNMVREGMTMPAYYGEVTNSCALDRCMDRCAELFDWKAKYPVREMGNGKVRAAGVGMSMQGSGISGIDVGSATLKLNDEGVYTMNIGAADMGTGCDTILAQIAAEVLECNTDDISVFGADTDISPYDSGSYASSTTYITGKAVEKCALELRDRIETLGAKILGCNKCDVKFDGSKVICESGNNKDKSVTLADIATASMCGNDISLSVTNTHSSPISPPPFMVGAAEVEVDLLTGESHIVEYDACVDCGTPVNPNLARVQAEGGILQGIGMAMSENITYSDKGKLYENSFLQYKIPSRMDIGHINVEFESSYENAGPFGAKSIGEVVINTPLPAITDALSHAAGKRFYELPITPEQIAMSNSL